jgi:hypothetical protein
VVSSGVVSSCLVRRSSSICVSRLTLCTIFSAEVGASDPPNAGVSPTADGPLGLPFLSGVMDEEAVPKVFLSD